jgi:hypothetical protein
MIVAIHAYESNYEGLYGICYDGIEKVETKDKARKIASMYAENVCFESTDVCRIFQENAIRAGLKENTEE